MAPESSREVEPEPNRAVAPDPGQVAVREWSRATSPTGGRVAVIGGGIAGLATAWRLCLAGRRVTLFEAGATLGGLGDTFDHDGHPLERFYHCMLPTDRHLLGLLGEIGLGDAPQWKETTFGILSGDRLHRLNTPMDLLRFDALSPLERLRVGFTGAWGSVRSARGLDHISCEAWLTGLSGRRAFERFWLPMLQAKFGDHYREIPALWFWTRFNREKGAKVERKGYPQGGYRRIADRLGQQLAARGAVIRMRTPVERLALATDGRVVVQSGRAADETDAGSESDGRYETVGRSEAGARTERFDQVVYAGPHALLPRMVDYDSLGVKPPDLGAGIDMQGVVNAVLLLRRGLTPHYWVATVDPEVPFQGIVETTTLVDREHTGGAHLVYLMQYLHRDDPRFLTDETTVLDRYWRGLRKLFPDLGDDDRIAGRVFRSPFVEPIYRLGYQDRKPRVRLVPGRVYLATTAQIYPHVTSWNGSCGLAEEVAAAVLADTSNTSNTSDTSDTSVKPAIESSSRWRPKVASA